MIYCVNDAAVMGAWSKDQGVTDEDFITMAADPTSALTLALDMELKEWGEGQAEVDLVRAQMSLRRALLRERLARRR